MAIEGADVTPVAPSVTGNAVKTNAEGLANVPLRIGQKTAWIVVSKEGYIGQDVPVPQKWPLKIVLKPIPRPDARSEQ